MSPDLVVWLETTAKFFIVLGWIAAFALLVFFLLWLCYRERTRGRRR